MFGRWWVVEELIEEEGGIRQKRGHTATGPLYGAVVAGAASINGDGARLGVAR